MIQVTELTIEDDVQRGRVVLKRRSEDAYTVAWFCGEGFNFTRDGLRDTIANIDRIAGFSDVWMKGKPDVSGNSFHARIADGRMYAEREPSERANSVSWDDLKKAVRRITQKSKVEPETDEPDTDDADEEGIDLVTGTDDEGEDDEGVGVAGATEEGED